IQIVDKELAKVLVNVTPAEMCIIRQFLDEYPKLTEKQLRRLQDTEAQNSMNNKALQVQKKVLLEEECGCIDYGIEETIEQNCVKQIGNEEKLVANRGESMRKEVLLKTECGCSDYGVEELLEHRYNE
ncbi:35968_t:CDS:1, partial [Gigaspora margarita]